MFLFFADKRIFREILYWWRYRVFFYELSRGVLHAYINDVDSASTMMWFSIKFVILLGIFCIHNFVIEIQCWNWYRFRNRLRCFIKKDLKNLVGSKIGPIDFNSTRLVGHGIRHTVTRYTVNRSYGVILFLDISDYIYIFIR